MNNTYPTENMQNTQHQINMETLTRKLMHEDNRNLRLMKNYKRLLWILVILYSLLFIINPDPELHWYNRLGGACYVLAFMLFAFVFKRYHEEYRQIDYSLPSAEMYSKAADRYTFRLKRILVLLPSLLLIDAGLSLSEYSRWISPEAFQRIILVQLFYWPVILISGMVGYLIWRKRQKPLRDGAIEILKELHGN